MTATEPEDSDDDEDQDELLSQDSPLYVISVTYSD